MSGALSSSLELSWSSYGNVRFMYDRGYMPRDATYAVSYNHTLDGWDGVIGSRRQFFPDIEQAKLWVEAMYALRI